MAYTFRFTSTHDDLREAFYAHRTVRTGMRWWARAGLAGLGLMWLVAALFFIATGEPTRPFWLPLVWLALGIWFCWRFVLEEQRVLPAPR